MSKKRITITLYSGVPAPEALARIAKWIANYEREPERFPLTGVVSYHDGLVLVKGQGNGFIAYKEESA